MFRVVIPARFASTRLPGKALLPMAGKPMIQWVWERAGKSRAAEILVATDDARIADAAKAFGAAVAMTAATHPSGTDRIAEVARTRGWGPSDIVVNVQGDEPLIPPALIDQVAGLLENNAQADMATLAMPLTRIEQLMDPNVVKVLMDSSGRALYFSRAPIPWQRDSAPSGLASQTSFAGARRHVGIYSYRVGALARLASWSATPLETAEKLEQLRALENGLQIRVADCVEPAGPDVNTLEDVDRVQKQLVQQDQAKNDR